MTLTNSEDMDKYIEDFPEQYQCRLFYSLLKDPVKLPTSTSIVERAHIHSYLLGDERDPFNRMPLKVEDLIPMPELKLEIELWKKQRLEEILGAKKKGESEMLVESQEEGLKALHFGAD